jgi:hypothetical protein
LSLSCTGYDKWIDEHLSPEISKNQLNFQKKSPKINELIPAAWQIIPLRVGFPSPLKIITSHLLIFIISVFEIRGSFWNFSENLNLRLGQLK